MQQIPQKTLISIISDHVDAWRRSTGMSREAVAEIIVSRYRSDNKHRLPGVKDFSNDQVSNIDDICEARRVNADRVFRWLDDRSKETTLLPLNFLPSVLNAMPSDLRMECVNQILIQVGMFAQNIEISDHDDECCDPLSILKKIIKESREAEQSTCELIDGYDEKELLQAQKEFNDLVEVAKAGSIAVSKQILNLRRKNVTEINAARK